MDLDFTGMLTDGPLTGATISGTDFLLLRHDGIGQLNVQERITQGDRVVASLRSLGYAVPPIALPELSVLFTPDFEWPDIELPMHGAAFFEAASEEVSAATASACLRACHRGLSSITADLSPGHVLHRCGMRCCLT